MGGDSDTSSSSELVLAPPVENEAPSLLKFIDCLLNCSSLSLAGDAPGVDPLLDRSRGASSSSSSISSSMLSDLILSGLLDSSRQKFCKFENGNSELSLLKCSGIPPGLRKGRGRRGSEPRPWKLLLRKGGWGAPPWLGGKPGR